MENMIRTEMRTAHLAQMMENSERQDETLYCTDNGENFYPHKDSEADESSETDNEVQTKENVRLNQIWSLCDDEKKCWINYYLYLLQLFPIPLWSFLP